MPRTDTYRSFAELSASEPPSSFRIHRLERDRSVVILAPHGGGIERGTRRISRAIAGHDWSWYCFEGRLEAGNRRLHITSTNFDEAGAVGLVERADVALAVHGAHEQDGSWTMVGGRDGALADDIGTALRIARFELRACDARRRAGDARNICNRTARGAGVQLELSRALRDRLIGDGALRDRYVAAVRGAIAARRA